MKLYELTGQYLALQNLDMPEEDLADSLEGLTGEIEIKAQHISHVLTNLGTSAIDAEIKRLQDMKRVYVNRAESLKSYLRDNMIECGINKITWDTGSITLRKATQAVQVDDTDALPEKYQRKTITADKAAIKAALKSGESIQGCSLVEGQRGLLFK